MYSASYCIHQTKMKPIYSFNFCKITQFLTQKSPETHKSIVLSGFYSDNEATSCVEVNNGIKQCEQCEKSEQWSLNSDLQQANIRIVPHVASVARNCLTWVDVSSNDTDIFMNNFFSFGMEELYIKFRTGTNKSICTTSHTW